MKNLIVVTVFMSLIFNITFKSKAQESNNDNFDINKKWEELKDWAYRAENKELKFSDLEKEISFASSFSYQPTFTTSLNEIVKGKIIYKVKISMDAKGKINCLFSEFKHRSSNQGYLYPLNYNLSASILNYKPIELNREDLEDDYNLLPFNADKQVFEDLKLKVSEFEKSFEKELALYVENTHNS